MCRPITLLFAVIASMMPAWSVAAQGQPATVTPTQLSIRVLLPGGERGADTAALVIIGPGDQIYEVRTTPSGTFELADPSPGLYHIEAFVTGVGGAQDTIKVLHDRSASIIIRLTASEVITISGRSEASKMRRSAEAVKVIDAGMAKQQGADLGETLARTSGVTVQRQSGLGSQARLSLNGLTDEQIRVFLDGIPLAFAGYSFGIANLPVNLVDRIEIYSGVVPIRFGADALGGAINVSTGRRQLTSRLGASYQLGSFNSHRATVSGRYYSPRRNLLSQSAVFWDRATNDYEVDVEVPNAVGQLQEARVRRFHDGYQAMGANSEIAVLDREWADYAGLSGFFTTYDKDLQHNPAMTIPYGKARFGAMTFGGSGRYEKRFGQRTNLDVVSGYSYTRSFLLDQSTCVYDWFGSCIRQRPTPGEVDQRPYDQVLWDHAAFARVNLGYTLSGDDTLRLVLAPTGVNRSGEDRTQRDPDLRDPLSAQRDLVQLVTGIEYATKGLQDRLETVVFLKDYAQLVYSEESPAFGAQFVRKDATRHEFGLGGGVRFSFAPKLLGKASYEWATRMPVADEIFGDGRFLLANLDILPERSHNINVGMFSEKLATPVGILAGSLAGFWRESKDLIVLVSGDLTQSYQNVLGARSIGVEANTKWSAFNESLVLTGNTTYQNFRNTDDEGTFGAYAGDRIPNRPYLFANAALLLEKRDLVSIDDVVRLTWNTRYVHEYFRTWESLGLTEFKQNIPSQLVHSAGFIYAHQYEQTHLTWSLESLNITDERVYDFFGVQRPGRSFSLKVTGNFDFHPSKTSEPAGSISRK